MKHPFPRLSKLLLKIQTNPRLQTLLSLTGLSAFWLVMILIVNPRGEFPLHDDWMYARSVFDLIEKKRLILCDFQAATAFAQIL